jgi:hypothetical protein
VQEEARQAQRMNHRPGDELQKRYLGLISLSSKFWYVHTSDSDGWAERHRGYAGSDTTRGPTSSAGKCSIAQGACSRGTSLGRERERVPGL